MRFFYIFEKVKNKYWRGWGALLMPDSSDCCRLTFSSSVRGLETRCGETAFLLCFTGTKCLFVCRKMCTKTTILCRLTTVRISILHFLPESYVRSLLGDLSSVKKNSSCDRDVIGRFTHHLSVFILTKDLLEHDCSKPKMLKIFQWSSNHYYILFLRVGNSNLHSVHTSVWNVHFWNLFDITRQRDTPVIILVRVFYLTGSNHRN